MNRSPKLLIYKGASILFILLVLVAACSQPQQAIDPRFQGIDVEIESLISEYHAVGLAVAIVENGEIIYKEGFGYRDYENKLPVDEYTVFGLGSCTKAFTATILGILEDEGRIKMSDKPSKFLPRLKFYNAEMDENIQIGDLLSHSVGVSGRGFDTSSCLFLSDKNSSVAKVKYFKPINELREQFNYNNTFYGFAGLIGESITDQPWSQNLSQYIFDPLEMKHSYASFQSASQQPNFSLGYAVNQRNTPVKVLPEEIPAKASAGEIYSSLMDMIKWVQA